MQAAGRVSVETYICHWRFEHAARTAQKNADFPAGPVHARPGAGRGLWARRRFLRDPRVLWRSLGCGGESTPGRGIGLSRLGLSPWQAGGSLPTAGFVTTCPAWWRLHADAR